MASTTLRDAGAMPVPQEILQLVCKNLDRPDLKNVRLARRELNDAAEIQLFRYIYLRRNMDSFCRLRMIASSPHLAGLVKGINYSNQLIQGPEEHVDFDTWRRKYFGQGFSPLKYQIPSDDLSKSCATADLQRSYSSWCAHLHSQRLMQNYDTEEKDLEDAFSRLSQLEEMYLGPLFSQAPGSVRRVTPEYCCSLGRELMVQPNHSSGVNYHIQQFTSMVTAAFKSNKKLKVIEARNLRWKTFQQQDEVLAIMHANMTYCEHFKWRPTRWNENVNGDVQIGSMMRNAPRLRTVELDFRSERSRAHTYMYDLSRILVDHYHWPSLNRVRLHGFRVSDLHLRGFLAAHSTSLTSLDLGELILTPYEWKGKPRHSSWIRFIIFLRESLNLRNMCFRHFLISEGDENFFVGDADDTHRIVIKRNEGDLTIKERVERYVVEGGEFPLPWPSEAEDESRWRDVLLDFRSKSDATWRCF